LKKPVIQNFDGLPLCSQVKNCWFLSNSSVNQNPKEADSHDRAFQVFGILASYILSRTSRNSWKYIHIYSPYCALYNDCNDKGEPKKITSLIIIMPSMANKRSLSIMRINFITTCILSISCFKKMFIGAVWSIACNLW